MTLALLTLKLLVVSIVLDRNVLLFSKSLARPLQSCEPESGAPSLASYQWRANPYRNLPEHAGATGLHGRAFEHILKIVTWL